MDSIVQRHVSPKRDMGDRLLFGRSKRRTDSATARGKEPPGVTRIVTALDIAILLPLIPLLPFVLTWWLPWERWIPWGKLPKTVLGPYWLYCALAAWHFHMPWWVVLITVILGVLVCAAAVKQIVDRRSAWHRS